MKVLIVCSNTKKNLSSFVSEQAKSLVDHGIEVEFYYIKRKGLLGYLSAYFSYLYELVRSDAEIIHAHYGMSGLLASLQFLKPVVITFHGCDINNEKELWLSKIAIKLSKHSIFVNEEMAAKAGVKQEYSVIPCGVDLSIFMPKNKEESRKRLNLDLKQNIILFSGAFDNPVKNSILAKRAVELIPNACLLELKGVSRETVGLMLNACDCLLLTSIREGSPQIIKEAMASNCPIISTDVGDVKSNIDGIKNNYVTSNDVMEISAAIRKVLEMGDRVNSRERVIQLGLDLNSIAKRIIKVYKNL